MGVSGGDVCLGVCLQKKEKDGVFQGTPAKSGGLWSCPVTFCADTTFTEAGVNTVVRKNVSSVI